MDPEYKKGERLVLVAVLSEDGFINRKVYRTGKKEDESCRDYHGEMNSEVEQTWKNDQFIRLFSGVRAICRRCIR